MVVMVVALVVIGPERLPKVARTLGHLYGRAQRYVNSVKSDISRDMAMDEYRQLQQKVQAEAAALQQSIQQAGQAVDAGVQEINQAVASPLAKPVESTKALPKA
jgi:sec-independent protein translocase protein TatB